MSKKIYSIGSCQSTMVLKYLGENQEFNSKYTYKVPIKQVYQMEDADIENVYKELADVDVLLIQPITDDYKNRYQEKYPAGSLSSKTLISKIKQDASVIMFPVCYFECYYPSYMRPGPAFREPGDNHDKNLIKIYKKFAAGKTESLTNSEIDNIIAEFMEIVNDPAAYKDEVVLKTAQDAIARLKSRENDFMSQNYSREINFIKISDFIQREYLNKLLFYTVNHPRRDIYEQVIINLLQLLDVEDTTILGFDPHDQDIGILYEAVNNVVNFDIHAHPPQLKSKTGIVDVCGLYIEQYERDRERVMDIVIK